MSWASKFSAPSLEREYQAELGPEKVRLTRILTVLGVMLTLAFLALDLWAFESGLLSVWAIRGAIIAGLALAFLSTAHQRFQTVYSPVIVAAAAVMGTGVNAMIYLAAPGDVALVSYHSGLILIIMGMFTLTYLNIYVCTAIALALTISYTAILVLQHGYRQGSELIVLVSHLFLFVSTTVIGIAAHVLRDSYSRENYLLRHSLQRDVEIKEEEKRRASYLAEHDPLTGVANRLKFDQHVAVMLDEAHRACAAVHMLFLDLDGFKPVNDRYGHAVGDRVLKAVADRLRQQLRPADLVARLGGDEFVIALPVSDDEPDVGMVVAERIATAIAEPIGLRGARLELSVSIGVAGFPMDGTDVAELVSAADAQMYVVKNRGKAGISVSPGCLLAQRAG